MSLKKRRRNILIVVLAVVVLAALTGTYFLVQYQKQPHASYEKMGDASIPTITCDYDGMAINRMYGYTAEMDANYMRDTIYILQDSYTLNINIENSGQPVKAVEYRVKSLSDNNLIQNADATDSLQEADGLTTAALQIENMIATDREYSLEITLTLQMGEKVHYYTRIIRSGAPYLADHIALINKIHKSTYDYDKAEEAFGPYKSETDILYDVTDSFEKVTLYSTISWLSWDEMNVSETIKPTLNIVDYDDELLFCRVDYQVGRELDTTAPEYYSVSEYFRTRINETSTYLLDYERTTSELFYPSGDLVSKDHINLGIISPDSISSMCSPDGNRIAFVANKSLWLMSSKTKELTSVFRFISDNTDLRDVNPEHDINIVNVSDDGNIQFLVYGYMNKGIHEGRCGIGLYTYKCSEMTVTEDAFIPADIPYQLLKHSIGNLCYMNTEGRLYIMLNGDVYSIDSGTNVANLEVAGLSEDTCKVSEDHSILAWQEDSKVNDADTIHVLNMDTLKTYTVTAEEGTAIKALGFLNHDLIYGQGDPENIYTDANDKEYLLMTHAYAVNSDGQVQNDTTEDGFYFISANQEYNRIILNRVTANPDEDGYRTAEAFTIFSTELNEYPKTTVYKATEETRGPVVLLGTPTTNSSSTPLNIILSTSTIFSSEEVADMKQLIADDWNYYVYAKGGLLGPETNPATAVTKAYDNTGCVVNPDMSYFYRRGMRAAWVELPQETIDHAIEVYNNGNALNITGIEVAQAMTFTSRRIPLIWERGESTYVIAGYSTADALELYDIATGEITYLGYNAADNIFTKSGRVFVVEQ